MIPRFHGWLRCRFLAIPGLALLVACGDVPAAAAANGTAGYQLRRWTTENGLPQNRIACVKQTRDGYLWIGTWFGLARFDGVRFTVFDKFNTPELASDNINALVEDAEGVLWVGTSAGLVSYQEHRFRRFGVADGLPDEKIWQLSVCRAGGIWMQSGLHIAHWKRGQIIRQRDLGEISQTGAIRSLNEDAAGWLQVVMDHFWVALSPELDQLQTNVVADASKPFLWRGVKAKADGQFWLGTRLGLHHRAPLDATWTDAAEFVGRTVDFIHEDTSGNLWVNILSGGLYRWDKRQWAAIDLGERGAICTTVCLEEDREGNVWLGTDGGLVQLKIPALRTFTSRDGLRSDHLWTVCEGTGGKIWLGGNRGLDLIQGNRVIPISVDDRNTSHPDRCVWPARSGGVWLAKPGVGLLEFTDRLHPRLWVDSLPSPEIHALYEDRSGKLWIGTGNGAVAIQNQEIVNIFTNWAGHAGYDVRCMWEDREGTLWFGTQGQGLTRMRDGKFQVFTMHNGLSSDRVWAIHEDSEGTLWLGTENGLTRCRQGRLFPIMRQHGLLEDAVNWILEDDFGYLWLSGLRGIYRVKRAQLNEVAEGRAATLSVAAFGTADGMESSETNGEGQPAGWKARDGQLWFPTTRGVVVVDPQTVKLGEVLPPVVIERVKADDEVIFGDGATCSFPQFRLPAGRAQVVEIDYTANTFADAERTRFRHRLVLVGRDAVWRDETTERVAHYTNLRPGDYRFEVMAVDHHGVWNPRPASFSFSLAPHFHETWPFYLLCAGLVIGAAAGVQAYRLRWQHRLLKLEAQQALASERARIARDLHDDLGTALTGLALQLNVIGREAGQTPPVAERLADAAGRTRELAERMREVVWTINPACDTVSSLASFLEQQVAQFLGATGLRVRLDFPEDIPALPLGAEARHQLALSVREALTNVVRHAHASEVTVSLALADNTLTVKIRDNGRGFEVREQAGHGLANLRERLAQVGGGFECVSAAGAGTIVTFRLPLPGRAAGAATA